MKVTLLNLIKQLLKKKVFFYPQKFLNRKNFFIGLFLIFLLAFFSYFLKPIYFDYNENKDIIQNKINDKFKLQTIIEGNISYSAFPSPTIIVNNVKIDFGKNKSSQIIIKKMVIKTGYNKISNINKLDFKKIILIEQDIKINPSNLKQLFNFFTLHKEGQVILKNTKVIFEDSQKNTINFDKVDLLDKFKNKKHKITSQLYFSNNKIKIKFENFIDAEKSLKIDIPNLNQNLEINFNKQSTLKNLIGQLKLNIFDSILLLNFEGKDNFNISKSYLRNKFLNSKIDGQIFFKDPFTFNIDMGVNQVNIRKLFKFYPIFKTGKISKKINGKLNVDIKTVETFFGKIKNTNLQLNFQNGDLKISNIKSQLPFSSILDSNIILLLNKKKPEIVYDLKLTSENADKLLRKFGIYDFNKKKVTWYTKGTIDLKSKKIKITKLLKDQVQIKNKSEIKIIEDAFNQNVINDEITGLFDLFKFKKFIKEVY
tara:strand:+ start:247 stop:1692 length:1446 start_codon:yes stop_codon:yes gene_type:complete